MREALVDATAFDLLPDREGQARMMTVTGHGSQDDGHWYSPAAVRRMLLAVVAAEREACALACEAEHVGVDVCDDCNHETDESYNRALRDGANAIRERSNGGAEPSSQTARPDAAMRCEYCAGTGEHFGKDGQAPCPYCDGRGHDA